MLRDLRSLPVGLFGSVMGLAGLGLACRNASAVLPLTPVFGELWIGLAALALILLLAAYALKLLRHADAVREELTNSALIGFCAALPVGMTLVAAGIAPYSLAAGQLLWWFGVPLMLACQAWALWRLATGKVKLAQFNGGWLIVIVGGIVMPFAGLALGHETIGAWMFSFSALAAPFVLGALARRFFAVPPLPPPLLPSWFIVLVPPSLIYVNGDNLWPEHGGPPLEFLFHAALLLAAILLVWARGFWRWPFGAPWWAFTFPLDALAGAASHYAREHPGGPWTAIAAITLLVATAAVALVLARTLAALAQRGA